MSDASRDLIQAVFSALSSDPDLTAALGAAKIFDQIPETQRTALCGFGARHHHRLEHCDGGWRRG